ncbi:MAG: helix-turn-helix transcriptional regulator [Bacilli bacterium]|nr:helix-turn-helix transcriptional regulator [Bacilli bacterium]
MYKINGRKIKEKRKSLRMSQDDLANKVGVSKVAICWYESGDRTPSLDNFLKLADALELSLDEAAGREVNIVSEQNEPYGVKLSKQDIAIINEFKNYPKLYNALYDDPQRTVKLIERRMK